MNSTKPHNDITPDDLPCKVSATIAALANKHVETREQHQADVDKIQELQKREYERVNKELWDALIKTLEDRLG